MFSCINIGSSPFVTGTDIPDKGKDDVLTKAAGRPREGYRLSWVLSWMSLRSGLEWPRHVHSDPLDLEW
jgi:hypothetical protein